jgi:hypothetical protein
MDIRDQQTTYSFGLSATSQQYFSFRTNQPPTISQQYFSHNKSAPAISHQPNEQAERGEK